MAKPIFVTTTDRPSSKELMLAADDISVKNLYEVQPNSLTQMERGYGKKIESDSELEKAKETIFKNSKVKPVSLLGTDVNTSVVSVDSGTMSYLEKLEQQYMLGDLAKRLCKVPGFSCGWFDNLKLKEKIDLQKYKDAINGIVDSIIGMAKGALGAATAIFGNVIMCATYIAASGIKGLNTLAKTISGVGNTNMLGLIGESAKNYFGEDTDTRRILPSGSSLMMQAISSTDRNNLSKLNILSSSRFLNINLKAILTPFNDILPEKYKTTTTSTKHVSSITSPKRPQWDTGTIMKIPEPEDIAYLIELGKTDVDPYNPPIDTKRINIIADAILTEENSPTEVVNENRDILSMTTIVAENVNSGKIKNAIIPPSIVNIVGEEVDPRNIILNNSVGNLTTKQKEYTDKMMILDALQSGSSSNVVSVKVSNLTLVQREQVSSFVDIIRSGDIIIIEQQLSRLTSQQRKYIKSITDTITETNREIVINKILIYLSNIDTNIMSNKHVVKSRHVSVVNNVSEDIRRYFEAEYSDVIGQYA